MRFYTGILTASLIILVNSMDLRAAGESAEADSPSPSRSLRTSQETLIDPETETEELVSYASPYKSICEQVFSRLSDESASCLSYLTSRISDDNPCLLSNKDLIDVLRRVFSSTPGDEDQLLGGVLEILFLSEKFSDEQIKLALKAIKQLIDLRQAEDNLDLLTFSQFDMIHFDGKWAEPILQENRFMHAITSYCISKQGPHPLVMAIQTHNVEAIKFLTPYCSVSSLSRSPFYEVFSNDRLAPTSWEGCWERVCQDPNNFQTFEEIKDHRLSAVLGTLKHLAHLTYRRGINWIHENSTPLDKALEWLNTDLKGFEERENLAYTSQTELSSLEDQILECLMRYLKAYTRADLKEMEKSSLDNEY